MLPRLLGLVVLLALACVFPQPPSATRDSSRELPSVGVGPLVAPALVGVSDQRLMRLSQGLEGYVADGKLPGFVTILSRRGRVFFFEPTGLADIESRSPMDSDAIFRIYSMSKPITSAAVMMLYEEGHFRLGDPVSRYIPEFKELRVFVRKDGDELITEAADREMTIRDLLTHTSGLSYGFDPDDPIDALYREAEVMNLSTNDGGTLADMIAKLSDIPLRYQPGTRWHYSVSIDVLGYLVEVISGIPFDEFLETRIFEPLGMEDTGFTVPPDKLDRFATNYAPGKDGSLEVFDAPSNSRYTGEVTFFSGGGGLVSTAGDYMRFGQMLINGGSLGDVRLLGKKTVELMRMNHLPSDLRLPRGLLGDSYGFGLGGSVLLDVAGTQGLGSKGSFGWGGAASTIFFIDPEEELVGVLMTQLMRNPHPLGQDFRTWIYQSLVE